MQDNPGILSHVSVGTNDLARAESHATGASCAIPMVTRSRRRSGIFLSREGETMARRFDRRVK